MSTFGGVCFLKLFNFSPPCILYRFLVLLKACFWGQFFNFENSENGLGHRMSTFGGVCFMKLSHSSPPYTEYRFLVLLKARFWGQFFNFENSANGFGHRMSTFGGVCFLKLFNFSTPYPCLEYTPWGPLYCPLQSADHRLGDCPLPTFQYTTETSIAVCESCSLPPAVS